MSVLTVPLNTISYKFDRNIINTLFFESSYGSVNTMFDEIESELKNFKSLKDINSLRKKMQIIVLILILSLMIAWICVMTSSNRPHMGLLMGISFGCFFFIVILAIIIQCFLKKKFDEIQIYYSDSINLILKGYNSDILNRIGIHGILEIMLMVDKRRSNDYQSILLNIKFSKNFGGGNINFIPGAIPQNNYLPNNFGAQQRLELNQGLPNQGFYNNQNNYAIQNEYQGKL